MKKIVGKALELMLKGTLATIKAVEIALEVRQVMSDSWVGDQPFPMTNSTTSSDRVYLNDGTNTSAIPVKDQYSDVAIAHMAAMLEEREQKMQALVALTGMLYLFYKQQIQDESLGFDTQNQPKLLSAVRDLIDDNFSYYRGLSRFDFCMTFERIVGNGKEQLVPMTEASDEIDLL